jgi:hypothetical protein
MHMHILVDSWTQDVITKHRYTLRTCGDMKHRHSSRNSKHTERTCSHDPKSCRIMCASSAQTCPRFMNNLKRMRRYTKPHAHPHPREKLRLKQQMRSQVTAASHHKIESQASIATLSAGASSVRFPRISRHSPKVGHERKRIKRSRFGDTVIILRMCSMATSSDKLPGQSL